MNKLLPRERIENSILHEDIDRIPRDFGGPVSGIAKIAYEKLLRYWKMPINNIQISDLEQQLAVIHENVLTKLKIDTRHIGMNPPIRKSFSEDGTIESFTNIFGMKYQKTRTSLYDPLYYEMVSYPLAEASLTGVREYKFPTPTKEWFSNCRKIAQTYWKEGYAVVADPVSGGILEQTTWLRGNQQFLSDLYENREIVIELLDRNLSHQLQMWESWLSEVGEWTTIAMYGDDYGTQERPLLHPQMWRDLVKPRVKKLIQTIKKNYPQVKIQLHSCGSIAEIIPDLIEIGFDVLNPVQPSKGMDHASLKQKFGSEICFHGGVDTQEVLPRGSQLEVENEVQRVLSTLASDHTGYIFATAHNILADVPPENISAAFEALDKLEP